MRGNPRMAMLALIAWLPATAHASLWRMDGLMVNSELPGTGGMAELLTAQIDDAVLAAGIDIRLVCFERSCDIKAGPTSAISFGGLADRINPLVPPPDFVVAQRHVTIGLSLGSDGRLGGAVHISDDGGTTNLDLDIASQPDGSWAGTYESNDGPLWTLSDARWAMIDPVDPASVPEPDSRGTLLAGLLGMAICARRFLSL